MLARTRLLPVLIVAAALPLAGCATAVTGHGAPGPAVASASVAAAAVKAVTALDPQDLVDDARAAIEQAPTVTAKGDLDLGDELGARSIDVAAGTGADGTRYGRATMTLGAYTIETRSIGSQSWLKAPRAFWSVAGLPAAELAKVDGKWVVVPPDEDGAISGPDPAGLAQLLGLDDLYGYGRTGTRTVGGKLQPTVTLPMDVTFVFETAAAHRLVAVESPGGRVELTYPDTAPDVTAPDPSEVVDIPLG